MSAEDNSSWRDRLGALVPTTPQLNVYNYDEPMEIR